MIMPGLRFGRSRIQKERSDYPGPILVTPRDSKDLVDVDVTIEGSIKVGSIDCV